MLHGPAIREHLTSWLAAAVLLLSPALASAAWLGYKNELAGPVTVQTSVVVNGRVVRGIPHQLHPGEIAWDSIPAPGLRQVSVYNPKANNALVAQENINVGNADIFLSIRLIAQPQIPGRPPQPPVVRLVPSQAPAPPGQQPPKEQPKGPTAPNTPVPPRSTLPPSSGPPQVPPKTPTPPPKAPTPPPKAAEPPKTPAPTPAKKG